MLNQVRNRQVLIDNTEDMIKKELYGILATRPKELTISENEFGYGLLLKERQPNKVAILASGGGGLGRLFPAVVHKDLADAVSAGAMDTAPSYLAIYHLAKEVETGNGVLLLTNNYSGDVMNNEMAQELLEAEGIPTLICKVTDNYFSAAEKDKRSGLSGILTLIKIAQAAAKKGHRLEEVATIVEQANQQLLSVTVMANDQGMLMYGKGLADEPARITSDFTGETQLIQELSSFVLKELKGVSTKKVCIQLNMMKYTSYIEGTILLHGIVNYFNEQGYEVVVANLGEYYDMFNYPGVILTVLPVQADYEDLLQPVTNYDYTI